MNLSDNPVEQVHSNLLSGNQMIQLQLKKMKITGKKDLPKLDQIIFQSIPDNSARLNALISGEIDLADGINPADGAKIEGQ